MILCNFWSINDLRQHRNRKFLGDDQGCLRERTVRIWSRAGLFPLAGGSLVGQGMPKAGGSRGRGRGRSRRRGRGSQQRAVSSDSSVPPERASLSPGARPAPAQVATAGHRLCTHFTLEQPTPCRYGRACRFAHGPAELDAWNGEAQRNGEPPAAGGGGGGGGGKPKKQTFCQRDAAAESLVPGGRRGGDGATEVLRKNTPKKKRPPKAKRSPQPIPPAPMPAPLRLPEPNTGPGTEGQHHAPLSTPPRIFLPKFLPSKASCPASKKATPKGMWKANSAAAVGFGRIFVSEIGTESLSTSGMKLMNCSTKRQRGNA